MKAVRTHTLVKEFFNDRPGQDNMFDFLVDEDGDAIPDMIYDSTGAQQPIYSVLARMVEMPTPQNLMGKLTVGEEKDTNWVFVALDDPL